MAALLSALAGDLSVAAALVAGTAAAAAAVAVLLRRGRPSVSAWDLAALALVALFVWRGLPAATPWPAFLDASWYVNTAARIADEGDLRFAPLALDVSEPARRVLVTTFADQREAGLPVPADTMQGFHDVAYAVPDVSRPEAVPYHPPLFASFVAVWMRLSGLAGAGAAVLPFAAAYLLAAASLSRRAFGPAAAPPAVLAVGAGPAFAYYGHAPFAEVPAGAALLAGLAALSALAGRPRPDAAAASAAGLCLGLAVLLKLDVALAAGAALAWWLAVRLRPGGRRELSGLLAGLALPVVLGLVLGTGVSRLYVGLNGGGVLRLAREAWPALALFGAALLALALAARLGGLGRRRLDAAWPRRAVAAIALTALVLALVRGALAPEGTPPAMATLLSWTLSPLGLWAAAVGLVLVLERGRAPAGPLAAVALLALPVVLAEPAVTRTLSPMYAARRLVPYAVPVAAVLASALVPVALLEWRRRRWPAVLLGAGTALVLANLLQASRPMLAVRDFEGGFVLARRIAATGGERDVFLFASTLDGSNAGRLAAMVENLEGRATAVLASPSADTAELSAAVRAWRSEGRRVLVVADEETLVPAVEGFEPRYVDETAVLPMVLAPSALMPPRWVPYELGVVVFELVPEGSG